MKAGELYRLKEGHSISYYAQKPVFEGDVFMILEIKNKYIMTVLVKEEIQTWDLWSFENAVEKIS